MEKDDPQERQQSRLNAWNAFGLNTFTQATHPQELDQRIDDLRTVAQWLAMNQSLLEEAIRALELQKNSLTAQQKPTPASSSFEKKNEAAPQAIPGKEGNGAASPIAPPPLIWWNMLQEQFAQISAAALKGLAPESRTEPPSSLTPDGNRTSTSRPRTSEGTGMEPHRADKPAANED